MATLSPSPSLSSSPSSPSSTSPTLAGRCHDLDALIASLMAEGKMHRLVTRELPYRTKAEYLSWRAAESRSPSTKTETATKEVAVEASHSTEGVEALPPPCLQK